MHSVFCIALCSILLSVGLPEASAASRRGLKSDTGNAATTTSESTRSARGAATASDYADYASDYASNTTSIYAGEEIPQCLGLVLEKCCPPPTSPDPLSEEPPVCEFNVDDVSADVLARTGFTKATASIVLTLVDAVQRIWFDDKRFFCYCPDPEKKETEEEDDNKHGFEFDYSEIPDIPFADYIDKLDYLHPDDGGDGGDYGGNGGNGGNVPGNFNPSDFGGGFQLP